jgi:hypothetical protein
MGEGSVRSSRRNRLAPSGLSAARSATNGCEPAHACAGEVSPGPQSLRSRDRRRRDGRRCAGAVSSGLNPCFMSMAFCGTQCIVRPSGLQVRVSALRRLGQLKRDERNDVLRSLSVAARPFTSKPKQRAHPVQASPNRTAAMLAVCASASGQSNGVTADVYPDRPEPLKQGRSLCGAGRTPAEHWPPPPPAKRVQPPTRDAGVATPITQDPRPVRTAYALRPDVSRETAPIIASRSA